MLASSSTTRMVGLVIVSVPGNRLDYTGGDRGRERCPASSLRDAREGWTDYICQAYGMTTNTAWGKQSQIFFRHSLDGRAFVGGIEWPQKSGSWLRDSGVMSCSARPSCWNGASIPIARS